MMSSITLDQLRTFIAVVDAGSFSAAGRRLSRVQSAVSQSVQNLEDALRVQLFDRATKTPTLTDAGRSLLAQARRVISEVDALQSSAIDISEGLEPALIVAVDNLFPSEPLLAALRGMRDEFPHLPVTLYTEPVLAAERRLRAGLADLALCALRPDMTSDFVATPLVSVAMMPVVAASHSLAQTTGPVSRRHLEACVQLILTDPAAPEDAPSFGVISPHVWRFVEIARRLEFITAGFGWANMPAHLVQPLVNSGQLAQLELEEPALLLDRIPMYGAHRRDRRLGPAGKWLIGRLSESCRS